MAYGDDDQYTPDGMPVPVAPVRVSPGAKLVSGGLDSKGRPMLQLAPDGSMDVAAIGKKVKQIHPEYADMDDAALGQKLVGKYPDYAKMLSEGRDIPAAIAQNPAAASHLQAPAPPVPQNAPQPGQTPNGVPTDQHGIPTPPPDSMIESILKGAAKSGGRMAVGTADLLHHVLPIKALEATPEERASTVPSNTTERVAGYATDVATAMAPGGAATKLAKAAEVGPAATAALRILLNSGGSGLVNKMQGGSFKTGAILGAGGEAAATGLGAAAPRLMKSAIPDITSTTAQTLLANTKGMKPRTIAQSANQAAPQIVQQMEDAAGHVSQPVSTKGALKVVDDAMKKAVAGNDAETMTHLREVRKTLLNTTVPGKSAKAAEALHVSNTLDDLANTLPSKPKTSYGAAEVAGRARAALTSDIDKVAPGHQKMHDTVAGLIAGGKTAKDAVKDNPRTVTDMARHMLLSMMGGVGTYGATRSIPEALAVAGATHLAQSPATRVAMARGANSRMTPAMINTMKAIMMNATQTPPGQPNMMPEQ